MAWPTHARKLLQQSRKWTSNQIATFPRASGFPSPSSASSPCSQTQPATVALDASTLSISACPETRRPRAPQQGPGGRTGCRSSSCCSPWSPCCWDVHPDAMGGIYFPVRSGGEQAAHCKNSSRTSPGAAKQGGRAPRVAFPGFHRLERPALQHQIYNRAAAVAVGLQQRPTAVAAASRLAQVSSRCGQSALALRFGKGFAPVCNKATAAHSDLSAHASVQGQAPTADVCSTAVRLVCLPASTQLMQPAANKAAAAAVFNDLLLAAAAAAASSRKVGSTALTGQAHRPATPAAMQAAASGAGGFWSWT